MPALRVAAISFLNTAPLMWDFERGDAGKDFEISYTTPSECASALAADMADIGIIPAVTYAQISSLVILPNIAIAAKDNVRSILLISKKPIEDVKTVATDTSSRTSVALTQVLFAKFFGGHRQFTPHAPDLKEMLKEHDAALLIGDPALQVDRSKYLTWDLAEEWIRFTGKPFVFAFWAITHKASEHAPSELASIFQRSRDHGLQPPSLMAIANTWSSKLAMSTPDILEYLTRNIHYYLDGECLEGLNLFYTYAHECKLIPSVPDCILPVPNLF